MVAFPLIAGVAGAAIDEALPSRVTDNADRRRESLPPLARLFAWAVLLLPVGLVLKPIATRFVMNLAAEASFGDEPGVGLRTASLPYLLAAAATLILLVRYQSPLRIIRALRSSRVLVVVFVVLLLAEATLWVVHLTGADATLLAVQQRYEAAFQKSDVVA